MLPISACVGPNGSGKTLAAIEKAVLPSWANGRPVVANLALDPVAAGYEADLYVPLQSWTMIPDLKGCLLLLDEISRVLPARQSMSAPVQLVSMLNQLRKVDVQLVWTAPNWNRCDVMLREVTQAVVVCRGMFPDRYLREPVRRRFPPAARDAETRERLRHPNEWLPNRVMRWTTYDAQEFDEFTYARVADVRPLAKQYYWRSRHIAQRCYGTLDSVDLLDHLDDVGTCMACGGSRSRPKCSCDRPSKRTPTGGAEGPVGGVASIHDGGAVVIENRPRFGPVRQPVA